VILDGAQRYRALLELGVEIVPCILGQRRETFTSDRMVNQVSPMQESRMIAKSLTELDEQTISATLGLGESATESRSCSCSNCIPTCPGL